MTTRKRRGIGTHHNSVFNLQRRKRFRSSNRRL